MGRDHRTSRTEIPPGTLHMLILKVLSGRPMHGYAIAKRINIVSEGILEVEEGSLYPALQRVLMKGWVTAEWGESGTNRRARFYRLTRSGRHQLTREVSAFNRVMSAISRVIQPA